MADGDVKLNVPSYVRVARLSDIWRLCSEVRPDEAEEWMSLGNAAQFDFEDMARSLDRRIGPRFCVQDAEGAPICVGGWEPVVPGTFEGWMVSTQAHWDAHWRTITKASRWAMDELLANGARRLQVATLAHRTGACEWYERSLRMRPESTLAQYGRHGEDVATFVRLRSDAHGRQ